MVKRSNYYGTLLAWSAIYIIGTLLAPLSPTRFNLTPAKTHLIQVSLALPIILIWAAAVYGAERFKSYAASISKDRDGKALNTVASGLILLILSVISGGLSSILRPWALKDGWLATFTILFNYLQVILPLLAFYIMFRGSEHLQKTLPKKLSRLGWLPVLLIIIPIAIVYILVVFHYKYRTSTPDPSLYSSFYLPDYLILLTLILPYLVGWAFGLKAAINILNYKSQVKGIIYKDALHRFVVGILIIISFAVLLQLLVALSTYLSHIGLGEILLVVYLIVLAYSVGFLVLASGAKKLNEIERVRVK